MSHRQRWDDWLGRLQSRYGEQRIDALVLLFIVGLASVAIHLLFRSGYGHSALLYVAVPYSIAVLITLLRPYEKPSTWWMHYTRHLVSALVVFLASSALLFEGFICVLFFAPIYFLIVTLAFIVNWLTVVADARRNKTYSTVVPLLIVMLSIEGTSEVTTLERHNSATAKAATSVSAEAVLKNLATPFDLPGSDNWMLGLFPMPVDIEAGSLREGDIHRVHTRYHRWFFTNTHEGEIELRIDSVSPNRVSVSFLRDTSYFSSYVKLLGSEILLATDEEYVTHISLTIHYERRLDPAWYFHPIQKYAVESMAAHLISEVLIRE